MADIDLFTWWAICITGGSIFLVLVSIYLYLDRTEKRREDGHPRARFYSVLKDFAFVWVLLGLLVFYIISINIGSSAIFAAGNILVEVLLIIYLLRNRTKIKQKKG